MSKRSIIIRKLEMPQLVQIESRINFYMCQKGVMSAQIESEFKSHNNRYSAYTELQKPQASI